MRNLKKLYSLSICFVSALLLLISLTISMMNVFDLVFPQYRHKSKFTQFASTESFISSSSYRSQQEKERLQSLEKEALINEMQRERASCLQRIQDHAIESLFSCVIVVLVRMVFWVIHWKMYKLDLR